MAVIDDDAQMAFYRAFSKVNNTILLVFPIVAIVITTIDPSAAISLCLTWLPQLVKGTGNTQLQRLIGPEIDFYLYLITIFKTICLIQHDGTSVLLWVFVFATRLPAFSYVAYSSGTPVIQSVRMLMCLFFVVTNALRLIPMAVAASDFDPSGDDTTSDKSLDIVSVVVETLLIVLVCLRKRLNHRGESFIDTYSAIFWVYIFMNVGQLWILDAPSSLMVAFQPVAFLFVITYVQGRIYNAGYPFEQAGRELAWAIKDCALHMDCHVVVYVLCASLVVYSYDYKLYDSLLTFDTAAAACPVYHYVQGGWQTFMRFVKENTLPFVNERVALFALQVDEQIDYDLLKIACEGQAVTVYPIDSYLITFGMVLSCLPSVLMAAITFDEVLRVVASKYFWMATYALSLVSLIVLQAADVGNLFTGVIHESDYGRSYSGVGAGILVCQVALVAIGLYQWYRAFGEPKNTRRISFQKTLLQPLNALMIVTLVAAVYRMAVSQPVKDYGFNAIVKDYSAVVATSTLNQMLSDEIYQSAGQFKGLWTPPDDQQFDQVAGTILSQALDQINQLNNSDVFRQALVDPPSLLDLEYLNETLWGSENLAVPSYVIALSTLYGALMVAGSAASYVYPSKATKFADSVLNVTLVAFAVSMVFLLIQFYLYVTGLGYQPYVIWDKTSALLLFASVVSFCLSKLFGAIASPL